MKKVLVMVAAMMAVVMSAKAEDIEFAYDAGFEAVSCYIWRGQYNGGLSFQPDVEVGFDALDEALSFRFGAWGTVGASDWKFRKGFPNYIDEEGTEINPNTYFVPEIDILGSFSFYGATVGFTHYYYFGGTPFFSGLEDDGGSQTEIQVGYNFDHFFGQGAYINWYTMVAGADAVYDDADVAHRAWSSYIELGYDYTFDNIGLTLGAQLGMSPWESPVYGNSKFTVTNISLKINKEWEFDHVTLDLFGQASLNPDGIDKDNVFVNAAGDEKLCVQRLNGTVGLGVWF